MKTSFSFMKILKGAYLILEYDIVYSGRGDILHKTITMILYYCNNK